MKDPRHILITGASSGIGAGLAEAYAADGVRLALTGRDAVRLEAVAATCRERGATVRAEVIDVTDKDRMAAFIADVDGQAALDLVIANAGIGRGLRAPADVGRVIRDTFAVNIDGVVNTIVPVLPRMAERRHGQIAIMSSLSAFRGMPSSPAYCASKAAVRSLGEGLRGWAYRHGVEVSVICPGFIRTPFTGSNKFPMPYIMPLEKAVEIIRHGLARNRGRIAFPRRLYAAVWLMAALPDTLVGRMTRTLPAKS